mgnify:CR=1 FL=1
MSMAAGEYVSVSSQSDTENADLEREREELATDVEFEQAELAAILAQMCIGCAEDTIGDVAKIAQMPQHKILISN